MLDQTTMVQPERRILQEMDEVREELQTIGRQCAQGFDGRGDIVDQANHAVELGINVALRYSREQKLRQLERANARLCSGQYGTCESCGAQIAPARLDIIPHATMCVSCQRRSEQRSRRSYWTPGKGKPL